MVEVICDTSFLIHLSNTRIKNISKLETEIGILNFVVPKVVISELENLSREPNKKLQAEVALQYASKLKTIAIYGTFADKEITTYIHLNGGFVATLDKKLKLKIKSVGGNIVSLRNNCIVLEP